MFPVASKLLRTLKLNLVVIISVCMTCRSLSTSRSRFVEGPIDLDVFEGANVTFRCIVDNAAMSVTWCQNNFCTMGRSRDLPAYPRYFISGDIRKGEHHFNIINVQESDIGFYQCQVLRTKSSNGFQSRVAKLNLYRQARTTRLQKPMDIKEDTFVTLECFAEHSYPASNLSWAPTDFVKINAANVSSTKQQMHTSVNLASPLWSSSSTLSFQATHVWYKKKIDCIVNHPAQTAPRVISTVVDFPCLPTVKVVHNPIFREGSTVKIECQRGKCDVDQIRWFVGSSEMKNTSGNVLMLNANRHHDDMTVECSAKNNAGTRKSTSRLNVTYPPQFFLKMDGILTDGRWDDIRTVLIGKYHTPALECYIDSNPSPYIVRWTSGSSSGRLVSRGSRLSLDQLISNRFDDLKCVAHVRGWGVFARLIHVVRDGPPIASIKMVESVKIGTTVKLVCTIHIPPELDELFWMQNSKVIPENQPKFRIRQNRTEYGIQSELTIFSVQVEDAVSYNCCALNLHGVTSVQTILHLDARRTEFLWIMIVLLVLTSLFVLISLIYIGCRKSMPACGNNLRVVRLSSQEEESTEKSGLDWLQNRPLSEKQPHGFANLGKVFFDGGSSNGTSHNCIDVLVAGGGSTVAGMHEGRHANGKNQIGPGRFSMTGQSSPPVGIFSPHPCTLSTSGQGWLNALNHSTSPRHLSNHRHGVSSNNTSPFSERSIICTHAAGYDVVNRVTAQQSTV